MALSLELPPVLLALQFPILYLNNMAALAVGPEHQVARVAISFPILLLFMAQSWYRQWDIQWGHRYAMECLSFAMMFDWIDRVLLSNPDREGWYKIHYGKGAALQKEKDETANGKMNGNGKAVAPRKRYEIIPGGAGTTFWSRMWWGARLSVTNRYVGWSCQVKNINMEVPSDYPRLYVSLASAFSSTLKTNDTQSLHRPQNAAPGNLLHLQRHHCMPLGRLSLRHFRGSGKVRPEIRTAPARGPRHVPHPLLVRMGANHHLFRQPRNHAHSVRHHQCILWPCQPA